MNHICHENDTIDDYSADEEVGVKSVTHDECLQVYPIITE